MKIAVSRALVVALLSLGALPGYAETCRSGYMVASGGVCVPIEEGGESLRVAPAGVPSLGRTVPQQRMWEPKKASAAPSAASLWIGSLWSRLSSLLASEQ